MPESARDAVARLSRELLRATDAERGQEDAASAQARRRGDAAAPTDHEPLGFTARVIALWKGLTTLVLTLGGVLIVGALLILLGQQLLRRTVSIDPISVPKEVADRGYTDRIAAARLRDAILHVTEQAAFPVSGTNVSLHAEAPDIVVPKLGIPLDAIAAVARTLFGARQWRSIAGEFVERDKRLWLRLRMNGRDFYSASDGVDPDRPDEAMNAAALAVLGATSPVIIAALYAQSDQDRALTLAARIMRDLPQKNENVPWAYILAGVIMIDRRQDEDADRAFRVVIKTDPRNAFAHNDLGYVLWDRHRLAELVGEFRRAIQIDPRVAAFHSNLGLALSDQHNRDEALAELHRAIKLDPRAARAHNNLGYALYGQHRLDEAIGEYRRAIELDPRLAMAHSNLGMALQDEHKASEAVTELRRAIELDPLLAQAHNNLGMALQDEHKASEALTELRRAIELDPLLAQVHSNLGLCAVQPASARRGRHRIPPGDRTRSASCPTPRQPGFCIV